MKKSCKRTQQEVMCVHNTQTKMKSEQSSRDSENTSVRLQERSLDCLCWTIKDQDNVDDEY